MAETSRKAIIVLSEARSGSNWLASLMQANRGWGNCREWLNPAVHKLPQMKRLSPAPLMALIAKSAQSPATGVLGLKVFTHHLTRFHGLYGFDPLAQLTQGRETLYLRLERRDRVAQAVGDHGRGPASLVAPARGAATRAFAQTRARVATRPGHQSVGRQSAARWAIRPRCTRS